MRLYSILVVWKDGTAEYIKEGISTEIARLTRKKAQQQADFLKIGIDGDCHSINVVHAPAKATVRA